MPKRTNSIGRHLPTSGGLAKTIEAARELGCETAQIFVSNPQAWAEPRRRQDAETLVEGSRELGISPVVAHAKYLINLASTSEEQRDLSVLALAHELAAAGALGVDLVVVHAGSHGGDGEQKGLQRLVDGLGRARELTAGLDGAPGAVAEPLIENSVGAGTQLCSTFEQLGEVARRGEVRVCVDTAHAFVAGYDLSADDGGRIVAAELVDAVGNAVALVHLNDAKNELGSHRDGHRKVGEGRISIDAWPGLFDGLPGVPVVMETPYGTPEADSEEVILVKKLAGGLRKAPLGR
ncbi:MAG: Endonuclease IV [uncultured Rubrobacteraceae bacterium]|uniref:Endonuclease IV n=1 Tax=uncultured Rubrobacteraceae bacterium TaxID=349277 RepID=A0A6J4RC02_9ACTN|nr:MAG: Endonuclease IV [uncultured Rubrobacteraceae bacterium]